VFSSVILGAFSSSVKSVFMVRFLLLIFFLKNPIAYGEAAFFRWAGDDGCWVVPELFNFLASISLVYTFNGRY